MKTLNSYSKYEFLNKDIVYIGNNIDFTYGRVYIIEKDYIDVDSEYRLYWISLLNDNGLWSRVSGDDLCLLSDFRNEKIKQII